MGKKKKKKSKTKESVSGVETISVKQKELKELVVTGVITKKKHKEKAKNDVKKDSAAKVFEESEWDIPLKEGEQELLLPNKKYKGKEKLEPAAAAAEPSIPGFEPASI